MGIFVFFREILKFSTLHVLVLLLIFVGTLVDQARFFLFMCHIGVLVSSLLLALCFNFLTPETEIFYILHMIIS